VSRFFFLEVVTALNSSNRMAQWFLASVDRLTDNRAGNAVVILQLIVGQWTGR
jgi:hypothetical protein